MPAPKPLKGRRVVEFAQFIAGPTAAQLLADFGAEVIKVEPPVGDGSRALPGTSFGSAYYRSFNTSKESRVMDLRQEEDRKAFDGLLAEADAMVCNLAPATLRRLGLGPDQVRERFPHLVATYLSGFGQGDDRTCMDTIAQCEAGFAWLNGNPDGEPRISTSWPVDFYSGLYAAMSTAMAMLDSGREGGTVIDLTMMEIASAMLLGPAAILAAEDAPLGEPVGNRDRASAPSGVYRCADGYAYIYGGLDPYWRNLGPLVGGEDAPFAERMRRADEFDGVVERWTSARPRAEVLSEMARLSIPAGAVRHPSEAIGIIRGYRPGAVSTALASGENVPAFPALFDGERLKRMPAPALGGGRRNDN